MDMDLERDNIPDGMNEEVLMPERGNGNRRRRVKKRRKSRAAVVLPLLFILSFLILIAVSFVYTDPVRRLEGDWTTDTDVTAEVTDRASAFLKAAAMGNQVEVTEYIDEVKISRILTFKSDGSYSLTLDEQSYAKSRDKAYEQMGQALNALVALRLKAAGREASSETAASLIQDKLGMSTAEYLKEFGPELMPESEELKTRYNRSGIYNAGRQTITIDNELTAEYMVGRRMLALDVTQVSYSSEDGETEPDAAEPDATEPAADTEAVSHPLCESMMYMRKGGHKTGFSFKNVFGPDKVNAATIKNRILENLMVHTEGGSDRYVKTIHYDYKNNRFVSLRDMALALKGTSAEYSVSITSSEISIDTEGTYNAVGGEDTLFTVREADSEIAPDDDDNDADDDGLSSSSSSEDDEASVSGEDDNESDSAEDEADKYIYETNKLTYNKLTVDGREARYFTVTGKNAEGSSDAFMSITDIAMILDVDMQLDDDGLKVYPEKPFAVDISELKNAGFYTEVRSALVGDATTGEVYASFSDDVPVSIASTTKLMNLLCVMDALSEGKISLQDRTEASLKASLLSETSDGVIPMKEGDGFTVEELIYGMMLPSSNECALMLAELIDGSEERYVERMNSKAMEIGLSDTTIFYNCHGLPVYSDNLVTSKLQNQMSASDMFSLVSYLLAVYPQITDITSTREYSMNSNGLTVKNLNPMLYNLPDAIGLKTGTTYMAGFSLVSAVKAADNTGSEHIIVAIEYGAEDVVTRNTVSELMLRFGMDTLAGKNLGDQDGTSRKTLADGTNIPLTAEGLIRLILAS